MARPARAFPMTVPDQRLPWWLAALEHPPLWLSLAFVFLVAPAAAVAFFVLLRRPLVRVLRQEHAPVLRRVVTSAAWTQRATIAPLAMLAALPSSSGLGETAVKGLGHVIGLWR
jgi:hypothetical protein